MRADFYILTEDNPSARYPIVCRLTEKAYRFDHQLYIHTESQQQAQQLDDLLWTYRDISFIPHTLYEQGANASVQIGWQSMGMDCKDILINLSETVPDFFHNFQRIIEIVPQDPHWKIHTRQHYTHYRDHGCELQTHTMT